MVDEIELYPISAMIPFEFSTCFETQFGVIVLKINYYSNNDDFTYGLNGSRVFSILKIIKK